MYAPGPRPCVLVGLPSSHRLLPHVFGFHRSPLTAAFVFCVLLPQRDGCPKIVNLGSSKTDLFYERKKYGFRKR